MEKEIDQIQIRPYGDAALPVLVYLPGLHGDWTLVASFRAALQDRVRFVEVTYPRTLAWTMADYTLAIGDALAKHGITRAWVIGESWGSQLAWALLERPGLEIQGVVLAAGFVKHPWKRGPRLLRAIGRAMPRPVSALLLRIYAGYSRFRHAQAPETRANIAEFVARRRVPLDRAAMQHRLVLLDEYDPRAIARRTRMPVHYIAGLVDPLVPWPLVRRWLRRNCPGYRGGKTIWLADHNVLATAPARAAGLVLSWMGQGTAVEKMH